MMGLETLIRLRRLTASPKAPRDCVTLIRYTRCVGHTGPVIECRGIWQFNGPIGRLIGDLCCTPHSHETHHHQADTHCVYLLNTPRARVCSKSKRNKRAAYNAYQIDWARLVIERLRFVMFRPQLSISGIKNRVRSRSQLR